MTALFSVANVAGQSFRKPHRVMGRQKTDCVDALLERGRRRFLARQALQYDWNCLRDDSGLLKTERPYLMASGPVKLRLEFCTADGGYCRVESAACYWDGRNFIFWPENADDATRVFWRKARTMG